MVRATPILVLSGAFLILAGCAKPQEPVSVPRAAPDKAVAAAQLVGKYRMDATPDMVAEAGGLDKLAVLTLTADQKWTLIVGEDESSGTYTYESGRLTLVSEDEKQNFTVSDGGFKLEEEGPNPAAFVKLASGDPE